MSDIVENQEDDDIILRPDTLACLQEFLKEKAEREQQESALYNSEKTDKENVNFSTFEEDWVRKCHKRMLSQISNENLVLLPSSN